VSRNESKLRNKDGRGCGADRVYYGAGHVTVTATVLNLMQ